MINISKLQEDVYDILSEFADIPIILQDEEGDPPAETYVAYNFKGWRQLGSQSGEYLTPNSINYTLSSLWEVRLNILVVGREANQRILELYHYLKRPSTLSALDSIGLTPLDQTPVVYAPKLNTTGWEPRYYFDFLVNTEIQDIDSLNYWEFLEITTEVRDELGGISSSIEQTIDIIP